MPLYQSSLLGRGQLEVEACVTVVTMRLSEELKQVVVGEVDDDAKTLERFSRDTSMFAVRPQVVVAPRDAADVGKLVRFAAQHADDGISLTMRSGGTDMTGGPLGESVVVDMARHFTKIKSVTDTEAVVEPGVFYRDFEAATLERGRLMPSYPASREIATVGGMVANNAGGEKTLQYGKTADYVKRLKVVLRDGKEYALERLSRDQLEQKMSQENVEGELYRRLWQLVSGNQEVIKRAKPQVTKNSAGYALWDVWDGEWFDLTRLFSGSQGTLGVITEITFRLIKPAPHRRMVVIFLRTHEHLGELLQLLLRYQPESFESYDNHTLSQALRFLPALAKQMGTRNLLRLGWQFLPEVRMLLTGGLPKLVLLAEMAGEDEREVRMRAAAAGAAARSLGVRVRVMRSQAEGEKYWAVRRESFNLLRQHVHGKRTVPFIDDVVVHPTKLPLFLERLTKLVDEAGLVYTVAGHVGDGNLHIIPLADPTRPDLPDIINRLSHQVYALVIEFGGSITGEHNDGIIRTPFLKDMYGDEVVGLFAEVKAIFDPDNIFNPGKKIGGTWEYAEEHLVRTL